MVCAWLDLSDGHKEAKRTYASEDQIPTSLLEKGARSLQTGSLPRLDDIWISPYSWIKEEPLVIASLPPIYAIIGEIEMLYPENVEFAQAVKKTKKEQDAHIQVIAPGAAHNFVIQPWSAAQTKQCFADAATWVRRISS